MSLALINVVLLTEDVSVLRGGSLARWVRGLKSQHEKLKPRRELFEDEKHFISE